LFLRDPGGADAMSGTGCGAGGFARHSLFFIVLSP
jgi:hypothetical protein